MASCFYMHAVTLLNTIFQSLNVKLEMLHNSKANYNIIVTITTLCSTYLFPPPAPPSLDCFFSTLSLSPHCWDIYVLE